MKPLVSIIIPAYNAERYIAESIQSAIEQTWPDKEIIVIDDGSTDNTLQIAKTFESIGVTVIAQSNKGASAARNTGLRVAKGAYIQFLDADDLLSPDKIESQVNCLRGSFTHLSICRTVHFFNEGNPLNGIQTNSWFDKDINDPFDFLKKLYAGPEVMPGYNGMITIHSWLTPRAIIDKAGFLNEELSVDDDGEFFCRIVLASGGIRFSVKGLCYYRKFHHQQSLSAQKSFKAFKSTITAIDLKYKHLKERADEPIIGRIFAKHYWCTGVLAYPEFKDLSKHCIEKGAALGYAGPKYIGGPNSGLFARLFGWKSARVISYYYPLFKRKISNI